MLVVIRDNAYRCVCGRNSTTRSVKHATQKKAYTQQSFRLSTTSPGFCLTNLSLSLSSATRSFKQLQASIYFIDMKTSHRQNFYTLLFP
jgi:hypothetical protein